MKLVCIHGNSADSSVFDEINPPGFQKISFNLPGHGSTEMGDVRGFLDLVKFCHDKIAHLENVVLLGSSLGGHIVHHLIKDLNPIGIITVGAPPLNLQTVMNAFTQIEGSQFLFQSDVKEQSSRMIVEKMLEIQKTKTDELNSIFQKTNPQIRPLIGTSLMRGEFLDEVELLKNYKQKKIMLIPTHERLVNLEYLRSVDYMDKIEIPGGHALSIDNPIGIQQAIMDLFFSLEE
jgi:hypothetical protein